jgi:hypothetical protein
MQCPACDVPLSAQTLLGETVDGAMAIADRNAARKEQRELDRFKQDVRTPSEDWTRADDDAGAKVEGVIDALDVATSFVDFFFH